MIVGSGADRGAGPVAFALVDEVLSSALTALSATRVTACSGVPSGLSKPDAMTKGPRRSTNAVDSRQDKSICAAASLVVARTLAGPFASAAIVDGDVLRKMTTPLPTWCVHSL